ncbi:MAG: hypothetical protein FWE70_01410 [Oscillospiraceae bacterium]|nr:hypothetical protein [Oscillospiraceae bacterium]
MVTSRERVERCLNFMAVDRPVVNMGLNAVGYYEHGEKLRELVRSMECDFDPVYEGDFKLPSPEDFDAEGNYSTVTKDWWGVTWKNRIYGIIGHPIEWPLDDWAKLDAYDFPKVRRLEGEALVKAQAEVAAMKARGYYVRRGWVTNFGQAYAVHKFDEVLADIAARDEGFLRFTALMHGLCVASVENLLLTDVDAVLFADDLGTQDALIMSPKDFREIYKPLYKEMAATVRKAGKRAFFHVCGYCMPLLEDFADIGFDAIWPQLSAHDLGEFARRCRELRLAVAIHPDRGALMTRGSPDDVRRRIGDYYEAFRPHDGGSWWHLEIDNGFPYENIEAMAEAVRAGF